MRASVGPALAVNQSVDLEEVDDLRDRPTPSDGGDLKLLRIPPLRAVHNAKNYDRVARLIHVIDHDQGRARYRKLAYSVAPVPWRRTTVVRICGQSLYADADGAGDARGSRRLIAGDVLALVTKLTSCTQKPNNPHSAGLLGMSRATRSSSCSISRSASPSSGVPHDSSQL